MGETWDAPNQQVVREGQGPAAEGTKQAKPEPTTVQKEAEAQAETKVEKTTETTKETTKAEKTKADKSKDESDK